MLRKLTGRSSPLTPRHSKDSPISSKSKSQTLIICSPSLAEVRPAKSTPSHSQLLLIEQQGGSPAARTNHQPAAFHHELLPPEPVISILDGFAKSLLTNHDKFELLKSKCLEGAKLGHEDVFTAAAASTGSILKSSHTVLTYLSWGIRHIEKASASLQIETEKESVEEHLQKAEQMLSSLAESMQLELDQDQSAAPGARVLASARVPNAGFIVALAHLFLSLVWKMRKNGTRFVAFNLLQAFAVCPRNARQSFVPELWGLLFRPHLSSVEAWYKKEHLNIVSSFSRSSSLSATSKPFSPSPVNNISHIPASHSAISRASSLMDLVAGLRLSKKGANTMSTSNDNEENVENDQSKHLEKINMQVNLLFDLYEQSLDEGTLQYARQYQNMIASYYGRFFCDQASSMKALTVLQPDDERIPPAADITISNTKQNMEVQRSNNNNAVIASNVKGRVDNALTSEGGWMGANALQVRRNLYEAIFGSVSMEKTSKTSSTNQVASLLRLCNKELPQVLDPLRPATSQAVNISGDGKPGRPPAAGATKHETTIRDIILNSTPSAAPQAFPLPSKSTAHVNNTDIAYSLPRKSISSHSNASTDSATDVSHSRRLIDLIQASDHHPSDRLSSSCIQDMKAANQPLIRQQRRMSITGLNAEGIKNMEEQQMMKRSNSYSSATPEKSRSRGGQAFADQHLKKKMNSKVNTSKQGSGNHDAKPYMLDKKKAEESTDVQVKYCTSFQVHQRSYSPAQHLESSNILHLVSQAATPLETTVLDVSGANSGHMIFNELGELANELREAVRMARLGNTMEDVGKCEEVLLRLSQSWLECKSATLLQRKEGAEGDSGASGIALNELMEELLFILATSELQEAQRLALCLLSSSLGAISRPTILSPQDHTAKKQKGGWTTPTAGQLPSDPNVMRALSHLLQQQGRLPEAALLLHLLHPAQYSASCHHFLPHLLPLLLDLAQRNVQPLAEDVFNYSPKSVQGHLRLPGDSHKPRALALMMMSRLLAAVDRMTRLQACKHVLFPNVNALPCLLHSLDCPSGLDERAAAAFLLTTCMQADEICRHHIVAHVKLTSVVALLQQSASKTSAFQTAVNFVTELLCTRKANITEMLGSIRQDGLLNCMHALMSYLQTASVENQPPAAGLLLQLDLLLGDEQRYSVFREEALEALLAPLLCESNKEACFNAAHVLSTIGCNHSEQELEAWLLKRAGLGAATCKDNNTSQSPSTDYIDTVSKEEDEEENARVAEWDERVARALICQGGGGLVSGALAKGLHNSMVEVRRACLLVVAWLSSHLTSMCHVDDQNHRNNHHRHPQLQFKSCNSSMSVEAKTLAKKQMKEALQSELQEIAAVGSGHAIVERVFAALALQNLT